MGDDSGYTEWLRGQMAADLRESNREAELREDFEQLVTDILFALDNVGALNVNDGPGVDDAREAVMDELLSEARLRSEPKPAGTGPEPEGVEADTCPTCGGVSHEREEALETLRRIMAIPTPAGNEYADRVWAVIRGEDEAALSPGAAPGGPDEA